MAEIIVAEMENLCRKLGKTIDPNKIREIECELEYLNEQLKGECGK